MKKVCVNVRSQKEWDEVTKKLGYKWHGGYWHNSSTCINVNEIAWMQIEWYEEKGYKILSFDEFMNGESKAKKYDVIITNTNKVIILDKETGKKGQAVCHKDDVFDPKIGFGIAWDRLNGIEPKKEEVKSDDEGSINRDFKVGDKVECIDINTKYIPPTVLKVGNLYEVITIDDSDSMEIIDGVGYSQWVYKKGFKLPNKKPILTEPEFIKCKITNVTVKQWSDDWCKKINSKYGIDTTFNNLGDDITIIGNVIGKGNIDNCDFYVVNYKDNNYVFYCRDVEEYIEEPKIIKSIEDMKKLFDEGRLKEFVVNDKCDNDIYYAYSKKGQRLPLSKIDEERSHVYFKTTSSIDFKYVDLIETEKLILPVEEPKLYDDNGVELVVGDKVLVYWNNKYHTSSIIKSYFDNCGIGVKGWITSYCSKLPKAEDIKVYKLS